MVHRFITIWNKTNLIKRISIGIGIGVLLAVIFPQAQAIGLLGQIFVGGLKAIAPLLVFALVANALSQQQKGQKSNMKTVILLYLLGTFAAALVAVLVNFFFPISIELASSSQKVSPPDGIGQVLSNLLLQLVDNPVNALITANYIGILSWAVIFGIAMREASHHSKELLQTLADITSKIVEWIINLAPLGILGLVYTTISGKGLSGSKKLWYPAAGLDSQHADCRSGYQSFDYLYHAAEKSLSLGLALFASQWCDCLFHAQFCGKHTRQYETLSGARTQSRDLLSLYSSGSYYQYGRGCHHYQHPDLGCCQYAGYPG